MTFVEYALYAVAYMGAFVLLAVLVGSVFVKHHFGSEL